jgi:hypothetical protein
MTTDIIEIIFSEKKQGISSIELTKNHHKD